MTKRVELWTCVLGAFLGLSGCGDKVIYPVKLATRPNTFALSEEHWGGHITGVMVWTSGPERNLEWEIVPTQNVDVRGFVVTVGVIREGFRQTTPLPPKRFVPKAGMEYVIGVAGDFHPTAWPVEIAWKAD